MGYLFLLFILTFLYLKLSFYIENKYFNYLFGVVGLVIYIKFVIDFLDIYLDSMVLLDTWVVIFYWEGLLKYHSEFIQWDTIDSVYDEQNWLFDIMFWKWSIKIKRYDQEYVFEDVSNPSYNASKIIEIKNKIFSKDLEVENTNEYDDSDEIDKEEIKYMAEAIAEIIYKYKTNRD